MAAPPDASISRDDGRRYWEGIDSDVNGMLGGLPQVHRTDIIGSRAFLAKLGIGLKAGLKTVGGVLEGGAG